MNTSLQAHRIETIMIQDGMLTLSNLPFIAGEAVEVIVLRNKGALVIPSQDRYPLRGLAVNIQHPMQPVDESEWDAMQ